MKKLALLLFMCLGLIGFSQERLSWNTFERLNFEEVYEPTTASWVQVPVWTEELKQWDGKLVRITGYIIALDAVNSQYALSAFPFSSCFFCGAAGPESVLELDLKHQQEYLTDEVITFKGVLELNSDPLKFPLTLKYAIE
ncbi:MAG: DUF3299 domain-containing protein [Schleiferiaceae bacterium]|jgi:hypothetical protein|nr:DUF3299 domain-containing protein [Schleiferiaceae bacterium]MDG1312778.1 DUF3299 domain-containing protein [Schleiferiaceae bacterium]MDG1919537.1 DUF3299 domain-containing protein [Schleiferiaceae bacterium]MDG2110153.1 DUF3299 domain-containing protein [Schleiferiaceae bacterium]